MTLDNAIRNILEGDAVLFLGAGFSFGAKNLAGTRFPIAKDLAKLLYTEAALDSSLQDEDLAMAAEYYQEKLGNTKLTELLKRQYSVSEPTEEQKYMGTLTWQRIYTTNYDNILERAYAENTKPLNTAVLSNRLEDFGDKTNLYVHLNGCISSITPEKIDSEIKLTERSYLTENITKSPWLSVFRSDLETASAVIFIGYSMKYDIDLKRIIYASQNLADKCFFITWDQENSLTLERLKKFGTPCPINLKGFVQKVKEIRQTYIPVAGNSFRPLCFDKYTITKNPPPPIQSNDIFNLYLHGTFRPERIHYSIVQPEQYIYYVKRHQVDLLLEQIHLGKNRIVVHSDLGNGKSLMLEGVKALLTQGGYKCYTYKKFYATLSREVETLCKEDKVVFFVENYSGNMEVVYELEKFVDNQILIFSERSALNDIQYGKIEDMFGPFHVMDLNTISTDEAKQLSTIFTTYGYWKYLSNISENKKIDFLTQTCGSNFRTIILKLLESPDIIERFQKIVNSITEKQNYYEALILVLSLKIANIDLDVEQLAYGLNIDMLNSPNFRRNAVVRELIDFDQGQVSVRSSIVAESVMQHIMKTRVVLEVLGKAFEKLNEQRANRQVKKMLRRLMIFTNLQHILNKRDNDFVSNVSNYYTRIGKLEFCNRNPHYWLQRAIVMLSISDYSQAKIYFETAYSLAKEDKTFDAYQIDNHYARYLLEYAMNSGDIANCMKAFKEAHQTLIDPAHKYEVRYYPYRVAQNYYPFYKQFFAGMSKEEKSFFLFSCQQMLERLKWYVTTSSHGAQRTDVSKAKESISKILAQENYKSEISENIKR